MGSVLLVIVECGRQGRGDTIKHTMLPCSLLFSLLPFVSCHPSSPLAMHRTDPQLFPHLVRTVGDQEEGANRNQRNYFVQKKVVTKSEEVKPGINFVTNGQPGKVK